MNTKHFKYDTFKTDPKCSSTYDLHLSKWLFRSSSFPEKEKIYIFWTCPSLLSLYVPNNVGFIFKIYPKSDNFSSVPIITTIKQWLQHGLYGSLLAGPPAFIFPSIQPILNKGDRVILLQYVRSHQSFAQSFVMKSISLRTKDTDLTTDSKVSNGLAPLPLCLYLVIIPFLCSGYPQDLDKHSTASGLCTGYSLLKISSHRWPLSCVHSIVLYSMRFPWLLYLKLAMPNTACLSAFPS